MAEKELKDIDESFFAPPKEIAPRRYRELKEFEAKSEWLWSAIVDVYWEIDALSHRQRLNFYKWLWSSDAQLILKNYWYLKQNDWIPLGAQIDCVLEERQERKEDISILKLIEYIE